MPIRVFQYQSDSWFEGLVPTKFFPSGWMSEQPQYEILIKPFNTALQQFSSFEPQGQINSITPQGWMSQEPQTEIFIRSFNVSEQQFEVSSWVLPTFTASLTVTEDNDILAATFQMLGRTIPSTTRAYASGYDHNGNTVYWYFDAVTGLPAVDSDGNPLNPFSSR